MATLIATLRPITSPVPMKATSATKAAPTSKPSGSRPGFWTTLLRALSAAAA